MDLIKNLTGKDPKVYEPVAERIINTSDTELFSELVSKDDFLFDFIKQNVAQRLAKACNKSNYKNLFNFLQIYSPYYDDFIASTLAQYADKEDEARMLELLKNGTEPEKTYAASFFSYIENPSALEDLRKNAYSQNSDLAVNCARALSKLEDRESCNQAIEKLKSNDSFEQYAAVKFLVNYQDTNAIKDLLYTMKHTGMAENIAAEIPYLCPLNSLLNTDYNDDAILVFCYILNGLVELIPISQIIDYEFYGFIDTLMKASPTGPIAVALMTAKEKFNLFVENEEYLFDEDKNTKNEVNDINILLNSIKTNKYTSFLYEELYEESDFIYFVMELIKDSDSIASLLTGSNQTVILKAMSLLKSMGQLTEEYKQTGIANITDENIKSVAMAL